MTRPKWDYLIESTDFTRPASMDRLNERGDNGWELVTVLASGQCIYKRQRPIRVVVR